MINGEVLRVTGATRKFCIRALPGSVSITLAWHDFPGSQAAAKALVNDLDLTVTASGGTSVQKWFGNGAVDRMNNVERVKALTPLVCQLHLIFEHMKRSSLALALKLSVHKAGILGI